MATPRFSPPATVVGRNIVVCGGSTAFEELTSVEEYDMSTNTWRFLSSMPGCGRHACTAPTFPSL